MSCRSRIVNHHFQQSESWVSVLYVPLDCTPCTKGSWGTRPLGLGELGWWQPVSFSTSSRPRQAPGCTTVGMSLAVGCCHSEMSCAFHRGGWWAPGKAVVCTVNRSTHAGLVGGSRSLELEWGDKCFHAFALGILYFRNFRKHCPPGLSRGPAPREDFPAVVVIREGLSFSNVSNAGALQPQTSGQLALLSLALKRGPSRIWRSRDPCTLWLANALWGPQPPVHLR